MIKGHSRKLHCLRRHSGGGVLRMRFDKLQKPPPCSSSPLCPPSSAGSSRSPGIDAGPPHQLAENEMGCSATTRGEHSAAAADTSRGGGGGGHPKRMADWVQKTLAAVPSSMRPKPLPASYTPFPLPRYDAALGFGPVALQDIPDVLAAQQRMGLGRADGDDRDRDTDTDQGFPMHLAPQRQRREANTSLWSGATATTTTPSYEEAEALQMALLEDDYTVKGRPPHGGVDQDKEKSTSDTRPKLVSVWGGAASSAAPEAIRQAATTTSQMPIHSRTAPPYEVVGDDALKVLDRLECRRTMEDLVHQFYTRPQREARTATVLDFAGSLSQRSDAELEKMFYELSSLFPAEGNGLQFLVTKVVKLGRPYYVTDELMKAFLVLLESTTEHLTVEAPERLVRSPALCIQLLHFLALLRIFEPNRWFSPNPNAPSNRADYSHPRGVNRFTSHRRDGEVLFDTIVTLVLNSSSSSQWGAALESEFDSAAEAPEEDSFLRQCTVAQLVELLNGFAAVTPGAKPRGDVVEALWRELAPRLAKARCDDSGQMKGLMERLYLTFAIIGSVEKRKSVLALLLRQEQNDHQQPHGALGSTPSTEGKDHDDSLAYETMTAKQFFGPDFFAAASQEENEAMKLRIVRDHLAPLLEFLTQEAAHASANAASPNHTTSSAVRDSNRSNDHKDSSDLSSLLYAVVESSQELLMACKTKSEAFQFARTHQYDSYSLQLVPHFERVAERLTLEAADRELGLPTASLLSTTDGMAAAAATASPNPLEADESDPTSATSTTMVQQEQQQNANSHTALDICTQLAQGTCPRRRSTYLTRYRGKPVHPIRTLLSDLSYISSLQNIFILHSSSIARSVQSLLFALRKVRTGKDALVCSTLCLQALARKAQYDGQGGGSVKVQLEERTCAARALLILSQEAEKGRVVLLPFTEMLLLHDPGVVCSEDLLLWTLSAFLARELPLVKVHTLQHVFSEARQPHHLLKGGHSVLRRHDDLYNRNTPLLAALNSKKLRATTHHVRLQQAVRDPPNKLHKIHPVRARFLYRRDKALYDKFHVTARHLAPGFAQGALDSDLRGLGFYTPDHPQPEYTPRVAAAANAQQRYQ